MSATPRAKRRKTTEKLLTPRLEHGIPSVLENPLLSGVRKALFCSPALSDQRGGLLESEIEPLKVCLRIRPFSPTEVANSDGGCISLDNEATAVTIRNPKDGRVMGDSESRFMFSAVFEPAVQQEKIFMTVAMPLVEDVLSGTNGLIFAYGQTNSGKTYTINGTGDEPGVLPRVLRCIFASIEDASRQRVSSTTRTITMEKKMSKMKNPRRSVMSKRTVASSGDLEYSPVSAFEVSSMSGGSDGGSLCISELDEERGDQKFVDSVECNTVSVNSNVDYAVWVSYLEIYNERIFDLLVETRKNSRREILKISEDSCSHVFVKGLKEVLVTSAQECLAVLEKGCKNRQISHTLLNRDSSRSHCVFRIKVARFPKDADPNGRESGKELSYSTLSVVDLAGSERQSRTNNVGPRLREASNINASLLAFGRCLEIMRWNQQHPGVAQRVVPFRDSKLTRLFQDYFTSGGKALMVVNVSPAAADYDETLQVLRFSALAKEVSTISKIDTNRKKRRSNLLGGNESKMLRTPGFSRNDSAAMLALQKEVDFLQQELKKCEEARLQTELEIREEVSDELAMRLVETEELYRKRLETETSLLEESYEKKIEILQNYYDRRTEVDEVENSELRREIEALKEKAENSDESERLRIELEDWKERVAEYEDRQIQLDNMKELQASGVVEIRRLRLILEKEKKEMAEKDLEIEMVKKREQELVQKVREIEQAMRELEQDNRELAATVEEQREAAEAVVYSNKAPSTPVGYSPRRKTMDREEYWRKKLAQELENTRLQMEANAMVDVHNLEFQLQREKMERANETARLLENIHTLECRIQDLMTLNSFNATRRNEESVEVTKSSASATPILHSQPVGLITPKSTHGVILPKGSKTVGTPTERDLMGRSAKRLKFSKFEIMDVTERASIDHPETTTTLWRGDVEPSMSGTGVSVKFKDVEVMQHKQNMDSFLTEKSDLRDKKKIQLPLKKSPRISKTNKKRGRKGKEAETKTEKVDANTNNGTISETKEPEGGTKRASVRKSSDKARRSLVVLRPSNHFGALRRSGDWETSAAARKSSDKFSTGRDVSPGKENRIQLESSETFPISSPPSGSAARLPVNVSSPPPLKKYTRKHGLFSKNRNPVLDASVEEEPSPRPTKRKAVAALPVFTPISRRLRSRR